MDQQFTAGALEFIRTQLREMPLNAASYIIGDGEGKSRDFYRLNAENDRWVVDFVSEGCVSRVATFSNEIDATRFLLLKISNSLSPVYHGQTSFENCPSDELVNKMRSAVSGIDIINDMYCINQVPADDLATLTVKDGKATIIRSERGQEYVDSEYEEISDAVMYFIALQGYDARTFGRSFDGPILPDLNWKKSSYL